MCSVLVGVRLPCPALPCPALPCPLPCPPLPSLARPCPCPLPALPCPALPCPALPCPALLPCPSALPSLPSALPCPALPCPGPGCLLENFAFRRAAGTGCEDPQSDTRPDQQCLVVQCGCLCVERRKEAESKKAPLEGGLGGEP